MLKVFLVEDEIVMREGIKNNINWEKEGFHFAGEASDGELAYPLIQKTKPDIIITDIKMPFMDGLELSRLVKKEMPSVKIIILSGYDEFEYAKEAINIGVTDYLVKPIAGAKLLEAIHKVAASIQEEREQLQFLETYQKEQEENKYLERQKFFYEMMAGRYSMTELLEKGRKLGMDLLAECYNVVLFYAKAADAAQNGEYSETAVQIGDALKSFLDGRDDILMFEQNVEGWVFLIMSKDKEAMDEKQQYYLDEITGIVSGFENTVYFAGVGSKAGRIRELNKSYEDASRAFAYRYLMDGSRVICSEDMGNLNVALNEEINLKALDIGKMDRRIVENFLKSGSIDEIRHFIDEYFESLGSENISSMLFRQYIVMDMCFCTVSLMEGLGLATEDVTLKCGEFHDMSGVLNSLESTKAYLSRIMMEAIEARDLASLKKYNGLISKAKEYIYENYDKEDISLNSVAASVNISPNHFSTVFSQEEGKTFIEFLTGVRMEKARELLRCSSMKSSEIGYAVGYKDPHYFSYIFKKTQDMTPKEFRMKGKEEL